MAPGRIVDDDELATPTVDSTNQLRPPLTLVNPALFTFDFDALRFDAAASLQLIPSARAFQFILRSITLNASPYNLPNHYLDIATLDRDQRLLACALSILKPTRPDYATADYLESFNWDQVLAALRALTAAEGCAWKEQAFFTVVFRSNLQETADKDLLHQLDERSHAEAAVSGGLLKYWFGSIDAHRRNLATCVWRSRQDAHKGGSGAWHRKARRAARELYEYINFSTWRLVIEDGATAIRMEKWQD